MTSLLDIPGLGPLRIAALNRAGIFMPADLIKLLPIKYRDARFDTPIAQLSPGQEAACEVFVAGRAHSRYSKGKHILSVNVRDDSGGMSLMWFNQPWREAGLYHAARLRIYGSYQRGESRHGMIQPIIGIAPNIQPIYKDIDGFPNATLHKCISRVLDSVKNLILEIFPQDFLAQYDLCGIHDAYLTAHNPVDVDALARAKRRLSFQELFLYQIALSAKRGRDSGGLVIPANKDETESYWETLPFAPTLGQRRALLDICADFCAGSGVSRLVQGDVGSGKTAVAFGAIYLCAKQHYQCAMMAPTEILAAQHYQSAQAALEPLGIHSALLTGSTPAKQRREVLTMLKNHECDAIFGTHALFSEDAIYAKLGLVITDEQHRFGVRQRTMLSCKGQSPHIVVMSATPIPRTLALVIFGDMNVSIIRDMPSGRLPVITRIVKEDKRADLYRYIEDRAQNGQQAYVICPLVEDSEMMDADSANTMYERLKADLPRARVGLVHGRMKPEDKQRALNAFRNGDTDVLVSTTVIEVGLNVPNATVIVINNPERFGLAQLHQLRGRVGRASAQSYCFLPCESNERLSFFCKNHDGFTLAEKDLTLRGPGQLLGQRQHGLPELRAGALVSDIHLLEESRTAAMDIMQNDDERRRYLATARAEYGEHIDGSMIH